MTRNDRQDKPEVMPDTPKSSGSSNSTMPRLAAHGLNFKGKATGT